MSTIHKYTVDALRALKGLVGEIVFEAAINEVQGVTTEKHVHFAPTVENTPVVEEKDKRRTRKITEEQRQLVSRNMAALQAYTKAMKSEMAEGTTYADLKKAAGERWKALSKEEKEAWISANMTTALEEPKVTCTVCKDEINEVEAHKTCLIKVIDTGKKNGKTVDESIKEYVDASGAPVVTQTPIIEKRGRGRPKKDAVTSYTPTWNVRRLSKTETDTALEDSMALPGAL